MADAELEPNDAKEQASLLVLDTSTSGHLSSAGDVDWFAIAGAPDSHILITVVADERLPVLLESPMTKQKLRSPEPGPALITVPAEGRILISVKQSSPKNNESIDRTAAYKLLARRSSEP